MHRFGKSFATSVPLISAAFLAGCLPPSSTGALKVESASLKQEVVINANYQQVYKDLVETARACHEESAVVATNTVQGDLYAELGKASVSFSQLSMSGRVVFITADIEKLGHSTTRLDLYPAKKFTRFAADWTRWAQGDTNCSASAAQPASGTPGGSPTRNLNDSVTQ